MGRRLTFFHSGAARETCGMRETMRMNCKPDQAEHDRSRGFSTLEVLMVMFVSLVIAALAIPGFDQVRRTLRISGDARDLNAAINQAKLMAAADFTRARVYIDLGFSNVNTFHVDVWNKANNCWQVVGDVNNPCLSGVSPVQYLSPGVSFGTGGNETSRFVTIVEWPKEIPGGHKPGRNHDRVMHASDRCGWHHDHGDRGHDHHGKPGSSGRAHRRIRARQNGAASRPPIS